MKLLENWVVHEIVSMSGQYFTFVNELVTLIEKKNCKFCILLATNYYVKVFNIPAICSN